MKTVVIFGGSGYVGKHIIRRIAKNGYKIIIPHQTKVNEAKLRLLGVTGQVIPVYFNSLKDKKISNLIKKADLIMNLKTLWDEKKITFKNGILDFNINLVNIAKINQKNKQFIYFSGLGINERTDSLRSQAIYESEKFMQVNLKNSIIIRPGIIMGGSDNFLKQLLPLFKISFFIPLFGKGLARFQPVFIDDVSLAIKKIIEINLQDKHIFEFIGNRIFSYKELYLYIAECMKKTRVLIPIPFSIITLIVKILEKTPFSIINSEQLRLFKKNNLGSEKSKKLEDLGINPQDTKQIIQNIINKNI